jgi:hypothetical protein
MTTICTVELGLREIRVAQADGNRLHRYGLATLPNDAYEEGIPTRAVAERLISALQAGGITAKRARVAISDAGIAVRDFRLPHMRRAELARVVAYEGKRLVPLNPNDIYFAWHSQRDRFGHAVYLVAARREMIDSIAGTVAAAGMQVERIDLRALALARGIGASDGMIVDWGYGEGTLVVLDQARPRFFRTFSFESRPEDTGLQLEELALSVRTLIKFMRSAEPELQIGPSTPLYLAGRFEQTEATLEWARQRLPFAVGWPTPAPRWEADFPWQMHLAAVGLMGRASWQGRIAPSRGGDGRVAA